MQRVDKATAQKNTETLRRLVKSETNKWCADCKDKDARWASWNIGVFICIRCSGFHRSMGTHISKVKSVDLDTWTNEQVESMLRWGNHRANLYWEAHLRPGHRPPDHKLESFIRSKYETRRWAREGLPPSDPSILEQEGGALAAQEPAAASQAPAALSSPPVALPSSSTLVSPPSMSHVVMSQPITTTRQPQPHRLLSASMSGRTSVDRPQQVAAAAAPATVRQSLPQEQPQAQPQPQNDLFSLDFHAPSPSVQQQQQQRAETPKKDVKQDILSLFSAPAASAPSQPMAGFGAPGVQQPADLNAFGQWGQPQARVQHRPQPTTVVGGVSSTGIWGSQSAWGEPAPAAQANVWGGLQGTAPAPAAQPNNTQGIFETQSVWGTGAQATQSNGGATDLFGSLAAAKPATTIAQKKDDVFGDIWGDFK